MKHYGMVLLFILSFPLFGETSLSLDMRFLQSVFRGVDDEIYGQSTGTVDVEFRSKGNQDVKGELELVYAPMNDMEALQGITLFDLNKASIKVRFPGLRITMGKTRVGWGEGAVFNSGDVLFGSLSPFVDLTQDEARTDTAWLTLVRWSPGSRTWFEAIYMPPTPQVEVGSGGQHNYRIPNITYSSQGFRFATEVFDTTVELGYLYKGEKKVSGDVTGHRPYLTLHGELYFDLYGSASMAIPYDSFEWKNQRGTLNISGGMYRQFQLWYNGTLSTRLEFLVFPYQKWQEKSGGLDFSNETETYALYLYPELNLAIGNNWNIPLMATISPIDGSSQVTCGFSWRVFQGFSFLGYGTFSMGESSDVFAWDRDEVPGVLEGAIPNGWSVMLGMRYKF